MKARALLVPLILLAFALQAILSMGRKSNTYDEPVYLTSGYAHLVTGDFRMKRDAPPLPGYLSALPLLFISPTLHLESPNWKDMEYYWEEEYKPQRQCTAEYRFAEEFFTGEGADPDTLLFLGRLPMVGIALLLGLLVFHWAKSRYGFTAGVVGLLMTATSPNLVGHAWVIGCDLVVTFTICLACFVFLWYRRSPSIPRLSLCVLSTGIAFASKFTALLLVPIFFLYILVEVFFKSRQKEGFSIRLFLQALLPAALSAAVILVLGFLAASCFYGFPPKPGLYLEGVNAIYENLHKKHEWYLFGESSTSPWWYYYLVAFVLKTTLPALILTLLALALLVKKRKISAEGLFLFIPIAVVLLVSLFDRANLGLRRILPLYPFLFILLAGWAACLSALGNKGKILLALLSLAFLAEGFLIFPNQLTYFNFLAGGPRNGHKYLSHFDVDSGQDLKGLARYMEEKRINSIHLYYYGTADPEYYKIPHEPVRQFKIPPPKGLYAISVSKLIRLKCIEAKAGMGKRGWFTRNQPFDWVGNTIALYKAP